VGIEGEFRPVLELYFESLSPEVPLGLGGNRLGHETHPADRA
jgi:hypothetical protein